MNMPTNDNIAASIRQGIPDADVMVGGDGHHFEARIISPAFAGKSRIARHQMVYAALGERMKAEIHALSMQTLTPDEVG